MEWLKTRLVDGWQTTLLGVSLLVALLMFTQQKITATDFLSILAFFNVAGYLLSKPARTPEQRAMQLIVDHPTDRQQLVRDVLFWLLVLFVAVVVSLSFYPLLRDSIRALPPATDYLPPAGYDGSGVQP